MALYYPQPNQRRPLILVGPPSIGRHELRQRLLDQAEKFAAPVPRKSFIVAEIVSLLVWVRNGKMENKTSHSPIG